jgi:hypothetical protein
VSKGSAPRPYSVDAETYGSNYDAIFRVGRSLTVEQPALTRPVVGSMPAAPATYVNDATGEPVDETWWPDAAANGHPPINPQED